MTPEQSQLNSITGSYLPAFFKMEIRSGESLLEIQELGREAAATYFHEYLHYIQDVSTFQGLGNMIRSGEYVHYCIERIKNGSLHFKVPVRPDHTGVDTTAKIVKILKGSGQHDAKEVMIEAVSLEKTGVISGEGVDIPKVVITFSGGQQYEFGALAVSESMAYIGEKHFFPESPLAAALPYHAAELLTRFVFPGLAADKLNIFALCDIALLSAEPGPVFYRHLLRLKSADFTVQTPRQVYDFFKDELYEYEHRKNLTRVQMLSTLGQLARHYLKGYFPSTEHTANISWIDHVINHAVGLRNRSISFPLDILAHGSFYNNPSLDLTMKNIGGPLQLNSDHQASFIIIEPLADQLFQPDLNWVMSDILNVLIGLKRPCGMKQFCQMSAAKQGIPDYTNAMCDSTPWLRANHGLDCSMTRVLKMWQIDQKTPDYDPLS